MRVRTKPFRVSGHQKRAPYDKSGTTLATVVSPEAAYRLGFAFI